MVVAMPRTGQQGILWWLSTSNFNSFLSPLCFFHRNSENVPCPHGWAFPPSPLALKPQITWTPWSVPHIMPQSLPGAPFSASHPLTRPHPLGPRSAITPSGKTFHPDWLGRPSPELHVTTQIMIFLGADFLKTEDPLPAAMVKFDALHPLCQILQLEHGVQFSLLNERCIMRWVSACQLWRRLP